MHCKRTRDQNQSEYHSRNAQNATPYFVPSAFAHASFSRFSWNDNSEPQIPHTATQN